MRSLLEDHLVRETTHLYHVFQTPAGHCAIAWNDVGVTRFQLPTSTPESAERNLLRRLRHAQSATPSSVVTGIVAAIKQYFDGERIDFSSVRLDLDAQDDFFKHVYAALRGVGWGQTTTYGALAKALGGGPEAARDVGQAMAKNPVPLIIPCHRVLAAGGKLGGFSAPGGTNTKLRMLELEGVRVGPPSQPQQMLAL